MHRSALVKLLSQVEINFCEKSNSSNKYLFIVWAEISQWYTVLCTEPFLEFIGRQDQCPLSEKGRQNIIGPSSLISPWLGFWASSSTDMRVDPAQLAGDSGVHSRGVSLGTSVSPRDNTCNVTDINVSCVPWPLLTYDGVCAAVSGDQGAPAVTLARVLARPGGAHHVGADVRAGVQRVVTLAIGHRVHINLEAGFTISTGV